MCAPQHLALVRTGLSSLRVLACPPGRLLHAPGECAKLVIALPAMQGGSTCTVVARFKEKGMLRLHAGTYVQGTEGAPRPGTGPQSGMAVHRKFLEVGLLPSSSMLLPSLPC